MYGIAKEGKADYIIADHLCQSKFAGMLHKQRLYTPTLFACSEHNPTNNDYIFI